MLLDRCYLKPPWDVYIRMRALYRPGDPLYTIEHGDQTVGLVCCARHSKGGHLESLAVDPEYQGLGLAGRLVGALVNDTRGVVSLTPRISDYFASHGFREIEPWDDGSIFMIRGASG